MKWFETGTPDFAGQQLVKFFYQAFFHRALPYVPLRVYLMILRRKNR
jgi:hypothetical protein